VAETETARTIDGGTTYATGRKVALITRRCCGCRRTVDGLWWGGSTALAREGARVVLTDIKEDMGIQDRPSTYAPAAASLCLYGTMSPAKRMARGHRITPSLRLAG